MNLWQGALLSLLQKFTLKCSKLMLVSNEHAVQL